MERYGWRKILLIGIVYISFVSLGLPDGLHGVAWPSMMEAFMVPLDSLGILLIAGTVGYLISSFFSGPVIARLGIGGLLSLSCAVTGAGLTGYAFAPYWWMISVLALTVGLAGGAIDAGLNAYAARNFSKRIMQWLHASYGIGVMLGPLIMVYFINYRNSWKAGYAAVGILQIAIGAVFLLTMPLWKDKRNNNNEKTANKKISDTISRPSSWINMLIFFVYAGAEAGLGIWAYTFLTEARGFEHAPAGFIAGAFWGAYTLGRISAGFYSKFMKTYKLIYLSLGAAFVGVLLVWLNINGAVDYAGIVLNGFAIGPVFPALVSGTEKRVGGQHAFNVVGMQMAASGLGYAVLPGLAGIIAKYQGLEILPAFVAALIVITAVLYRLAYYYMPGHLLGSIKK